MLPRKRNLITLIYIILLVSCVIHILSIIDAIFYPKLPTIKVYKRKLNDLEFPLSFRVCVEVDDEGENYQKVGYQNKNEFIKGRSIYNDSIFGWAGHTHNGSSMGAVKGFYLYIFICIDNIIFTDIIANLSSMYNWTKINPTVEIDRKKIRAENKNNNHDREKEGVVVTTITKNPLHSSNEDFPLQCKILDWDHSNVSVSPMKIRILFDQIKDENVSIRLLVEEKNKILRRRSMEKNLLTYFGPDIINENLSQGKVLNYMFSILL